QAQGRFLSQDPLRLSGQDVNYYRYVWNSTPNALDPRGTNGLGFAQISEAFVQTEEITAVTQVGDTVIIPGAVPGGTSSLGAVESLALLGAAGYKGYQLGKSLNELDTLINDGNSLGERLADSKYYPPWETPPPGSKPVLPGGPGPLGGGMFGGFYLP